jgi:hypothetical protein
MAPSGRGGMIPNVALQAWHRRRGLLYRSFPQPTVGPPQVRQTGTVEVEVAASIVFSDLDVL